MFKTEKKIEKNITHKIKKPFVSTLLRVIYLYYSVSKDAFKRDHYWLYFAKKKVLSSKANE